MYRLHLRYMRKREGWRAGNDKMGPINARHIVWINTNREWQGQGQGQGQGEGAREESRGRDQGLEMRRVLSPGMFFFIVLTKAKTLCRQMSWNGWGLKM